MGLSCGLTDAAGELSLPHALIWCWWAEPGTGLGGCSHELGTCCQVCCACLRCQTCLAWKLRPSWFPGHIRSAASNSSAGHYEEGRGTGLDGAVRWAWLQKHIWFITGGLESFRFPARGKNKKRTGALVRKMCCATAGFTVLFQMSGLRWFYRWCLLTSVGEESLGARQW